MHKHVPSSKALHVLIQLVGGSTMGCAAVGYKPAKAVLPSGSGDSEAGSTKLLVVNCPSDSGGHEVWSVKLCTPAFG